MARTLNADLLTAQASGYPTGAHQPAVRCILTSKDVTAGSFIISLTYEIVTVGTTDFTLIGAASNTVGITFTATGAGSGTGTASEKYDYSFDPTLTTNRLLHVQQVEERENDSGVILLSNYDGTVPPDLTGYYVDLGWGLNTSSGLQEDSAVTPRLWVMRHSDISGGQKGSRPQLYVNLVMAGVWGAILNKQPVRLGTAPYYQYLDAETTIGDLTGKTVYGCLKYLIETGLSDQTGLTFTLEDYGDQDDGYIDSVIPFPSSGELMRTINYDSPSGRFETYGEVILSLLDLTKCFIIPRAGLAFKIIYPQSTDTVDETYYDSVSKGHPFYEVENRMITMMPNHIEVFGTDPETTIGHWFDSDHYSTAPSTPATPAEIEAAYTGDFMPVTQTSWEEGLDTEAECNDRADFYGKQLKDQMLGMRVIISMDARVELYDRVETDDQRRHR